LHAATARLLDELRGRPEKARAEMRSLVDTLARSGWRWAQPVRGAMNDEGNQSPISPFAGLEVWKNLRPWEEEPSPGKPSSHVVSEAEARARLSSVTGDTGEARPEQGGYVDAVLYAFSPRERAGAPRVALVEAGTGTGKTLGYLAPASLWAEKNGPGL